MTIRPRTDLPIPPELDEWKNEADFTQSFVAPLIRRLGFSIVADFHGRREFGKHFVFGEVDRFGHVVFHGLQVKFVPSIGKTDAHGLVEDCVEAFARDFDHPHTGARHRISRFYAVNGGSISDEAREIFFSRVVPQHGDNARLIDGKGLLDLDRTALARLESGRETLSGVLLEVRRNRSILAAALARPAGLGDRHS